jgi:predicted nucleic acid-binding protein
MIIIDTSIWIDFLKGNFEKNNIIIDLIETRQVLMLECISAELLQGAKSKREKDIIIEYWNNLPNISMDNLWIEAGVYSSKNNLIDKGIGIIDSVIITACKKTNSKLLTRDKKILRFLGKDIIFDI